MMIKQVNVTRATGLKQIDDAFRLRGEVRQSGETLRMLAHPEQQLPSSIPSRSPSANAPRLTAELPSSDRRVISCERRSWISFGRDEVMFFFFVLVFGRLSLCERVFFLAFFRGAKGDYLRSG